MPLCDPVHSVVISVKKEQNALEILETGVNLITKYKKSLDPDPKAVRQRDDKLFVWSQSLPVAESWYAVWRFVPKPEKRIDGYKVVFREVWQHNQKDGRSSQKEEMIWQIVFINPRGQSLVIRVTSYSAYEEIINNTRKELNGRQVTHVHPNSFHYPVMRKILREYDTPVIRVDFGRGKTVKKDILAQLCVESIKTRFNTSQDIYDHLRHYVMQVARRKLPTNFECLADEAVGVLIAPWVWPDYPSSFRNYVISLIDGRAKSEKKALLKGNFIDSETINIERNKQEVKERLGLSAKKTDGQDKQRIRQAEYAKKPKTVDEIAIDLGIPGDTLYYWIRKKWIFPTEERQIKARPIIIRYGYGDFEVPPAIKPRRKFYLFDDEAISSIKRVRDERKQLTGLRKLYSQKRGVSPRGASKWIASQLDKGLSIPEIAEEIMGVEINS